MKMYEEQMTMNEGKLSKFVTPFLMFLASVIGKASAEVSEEDITKYLNGMFDKSISSEIKPEKKQEIEDEFREIINNQYRIMGEIKDSKWHMHKIFFDHGLDEYKLKGFTELYLKLRNFYKMTDGCTHISDEILYKWFTSERMAYSDLLTVEHMYGSIFNEIVEKYILRGNMDKRKNPEIEKKVRAVFDSTLSYFDIEKYLGFNKDVNKYVFQINPNNEHQKEYMTRYVLFTDEDINEIIDIKKEYAK